MIEQKKRFAMALSALAEYYGRELSDGVIALYWQGLSNFSIADIEAAIGRHIQNPDSGMWMPKIADIVRMIDGSTQSAAATAWAKVMRAVGSVGQYQSLAFDDPVIHLAIEENGGWISLCRIEEAELPFVQKRFETSYRNYRVRGGDLPAQQLCQQCPRTPIGRVGARGAGGHRLFHLQRCFAAGQGV